MQTAGLAEGMRLFRGRQLSVQWPRQKQECTTGYLHGVAFATGGCSVAVLQKIGQKIGWTDRYSIERVTVVSLTT